MNRQERSLRRGQRNSPDFIVVKIAGENGLHVFHESWILSSNLGCRYDKPNNPFNDGEWLNDQWVMNRVVSIVIHGFFFDYQTAKEYVNSNLLDKIIADLEEIRASYRELIAMVNNINDKLQLLVTMPVVVPPARPALPRSKIRNAAGYNRLIAALEIPSNRHDLMIRLRAETVRFSRCYVCKMFAYVFTDAMIGRIARGEFGPFVNTQVYFAIFEILGDLRPNYTGRKVSKAIVAFLKRSYQK